MLTTTMLNMEGIIKVVKEGGLRNDANKIIGGAPITADYTEGIGADGYASDASQAVVLAKSLIWSVCLG